MSALKQTLQEHMKAAMKAQDKERLGVIRMIMAGLKQKEVDERIELTDQDVMDILAKMVKSRNESIKQYQDANRQDLADKEQFEITIIKEFLPEPLSDAEVDTLVKQVIADTGATSMKDMGKVMNACKEKSEGRADMGTLSAKVKQFLNG